MIAAGVVTQAFLWLFIGLLLVAVWRRWLWDGAPTTDHRTSRRKRWLA